MRTTFALGAAGSTLALATLLIPRLLPEATPPVLAAPTAPQEHANCQDQDQDGYGLGCAKGNDCNDHDSAVSPARSESCNFVDDDCDGIVDDDAGCKEAAYDPTPISIKESKLVMGSPADQGADDERPQHEVQVSEFNLDRYEVTNERYAACVKAKRCTAPQLASSAKRQAYFENPEFARYPVVFVSWTQARDFCEWEGGRLPTEAEWELAARGPAPSTRVFPWGDAPPDCSRTNRGGDISCVGDTDLVGRRPAGASPWGAMDMAGNVWEWTADWYDAKYYGRSPVRDPQGPPKGSLKVMRGGCWMSGEDSLRVSCRKAELPNTWAPNVGFRCVHPDGGES